MFESSKDASDSIGPDYFGPPLEWYRKEDGRAEWHIESIDTFDAFLHALARRVHGASGLTDY